MMDTAVSDETLHAFVDGQLDIADSEALIARLRSDPTLAQRVCGLRNLKSMVRLAYAEPPRAVSSSGHGVTRRSRVQRCAAACLILLAGLSSGWVLRGLDSSVTRQPKLLDGYQTVSLATVPDPNRVMLHLDSDEPGRMAAVLDRAEVLLDEAQRQGRPLELEIVTNSLGINLLRAEVSPHAERLVRLAQRHANLHLVACNQTIARYRGQGQKVELLPVARSAPTAIGEIVSRLQQGWTYVRV